MPILFLFIQRKSNMLTYQLLQFVKRIVNLSTLVERFTILQYCSVDLRITLRNKIVTYSGSFRFDKQCAAVRIYFSLMIVPPHLNSGPLPENEEKHL